MRHKTVLLGFLVIVPALGGCASLLPGGRELGLYGQLGDGDVALAATAMQNGLEKLPNDQTVRWRNPKSGHGGAITPRVTLISDNGSFCRRYDEQLVLADGRTTTIDNTACRDAAGRWVWLAE
jgi:surface antigen